MGIGLLHAPKPVSADVVAKYIHAVLRRLNDMEPASSRPRRRQRRVDWAIELRAQLVSRTGHALPGGFDLTTVNVSEGGFAFISDRRLDPATRLRVTFSDPARTVLDCVVCHCNDVGARFLMGVMYEEQRKHA